MKYRVLTLIMVVAMFICAASVSLAQEPLKVGVVDIKRCLSDSKKGKLLKEELRVKTEKVDEKIEQLKVQGRKIADEAERQGALLSNAEKEKKGRQLYDLKNEIDTLLGEKKVIAEDLSRKILGELEAVVLKVAESGGYHLMLTEGGPWLVYHQNSLNVTAEVIRLYDEMNQE
jgi:outer membrane protein